MSEKVVFMGSPDFALPSLEALTQEFDVIGVVTQPDRPAGRGRTLTPPPVKELALQKGIPTIQPRRLATNEALAQLQVWAPDIIVVAAFGQILKPDVLDLPPSGCVNVHASLLPRWRGAAPIQAAILNGDDRTGITLMRMDPGLDTGPIISQESIAIQPDDTGGALSARLARLGAELLRASLPGYLNGKLTPKPQDEALATFAPLLKKKDGLLDFYDTAASLARRVRAFYPWPGTFIPWNGQNLKILKARAVPAIGLSKSGMNPGDRMRRDRWPAIATTDGLLLLERVQPPGKKPLAGDAFLRGARDWSRP